MKDRIKAVRGKLGLNQTDFGAAIGVKQTTVAGYENGTRVPIDAVITSICREFNVSEIWLREGVGEMFVQRSRNEELAAFFGDVLAADDFRARLLSVMARLSTEEWELLASMAEKLAEEQKKPTPD